MKKLIVMADDLGFSEGYNYGVINAAEGGIITTAAVFVNTDAAEHGVRLAKERGLFMTLHMNMIVGKCCSDPSAIPSIVKPDGTFYLSREYAPDSRNPKPTSGTRVADKSDFKREAVAQMERFKELTGDYPIHMEVHSIMSEAIYDGMTELSAECGIHVARYNSLPQPGFLGVNDLAFTNPEYGALLELGSMPEYWYEDRYGILAAPDDIILVHFHPGYLCAYIMENSSLTTPRCLDQRTLKDPELKKWLAKNDIELIPFNAVKI